MRISRWPTSARQPKRRAPGCRNSELQRRWTYGQLDDDRYVSSFTRWPAAAGNPRGTASVHSLVQLRPSGSFATVVRKYVQERMWLTEANRLEALDPAAKHAASDIATRKAAIAAIP